MARDLPPEGAGSTEPRIWFVCVNYNDAAHTRQLLRSVHSQEALAAGRVAAVVVDNASEPQERCRVRSVCANFPATRLLESGRNLGYFGGLNEGLRALSRRPDDVVVVGNNDLEFDPSFGRRLLGAVYPTDVLVVAPDVVTRDGRHQNPHCPDRLTFTRKAFLQLYFSSFTLARVMARFSRAAKRMQGRRGRDRAAATSRYIHMGIGACYVLLPAFFRHFGLLDASVFLYGEEALLAGQVASVGGRTYYDATLLVHHAESASLSKLPSRQHHAFGKASFPRYRRYL